MIWFACSRCGKAHHRPESSSGTMIFCTCGQGSTVPWESTIAEPPGGAVPPPIRFDVPPLSQDAGLPQRAPLPRASEAIPTIPPTPQPVAPRPVRGAWCLNHGDQPVAHVCPSCGEGFCQHCLVLWQGKHLCGPCKNAAIRQATVPRKLSGLALTALLLGLCSQLGFFCLFLPIGGIEILGLCAIAILIQLMVGGLGTLALVRMSHDPLLTGRPLAIIAVVLGAVSVLATVARIGAAFIQRV